MRTLSLLLLASLAAAPAAAQDEPPRRPPADTIRIGAPAAEGDSIRMVEADDEDRPPPREPGPYDLDGGRGPFTVQTSGRVAARPPRPEVVYADPAQRAPVAVADTARRDTMRRETTTVRRDTASTPARTAAADTARAPRTAATPPASTRRVRTHTVEAGETFYGIARRYGVAAAQLRALNPEVDPEVLEVGDRLQLPAAARDSRLTRAEMEAVEAARSGDDAASARTRTHTVVAGETLFGIARRYGVGAAEIVRINRLESDQVRIGQRLTIPPER